MRRGARTITQSPQNALLRGRVGRKEREIGEQERSLTARAPAKESPAVRTRLPSPGTKLLSKLTPLSRAVRTSAVSTCGVCYLVGGTGPPGQGMPGLKL